MKLEAGRTYLVTHQRKGTFMLEVTSQSDVWTHGNVVDGETIAMLPDNVRRIGESITCRTKFLKNAIIQPSQEDEQET